MASDGGFKVVSWGVLVSLVVLLFMVTLGLFLGDNLTSPALTLIVGMLVLLALVLIWQILKNAIMKA
jgi:hypothetical protein